MAKSLFGEIAECVLWVAVLLLVVYGFLGLFVALVPVKAEADIGIPTWRMPADTRRLVTCDGARLVAYPIDSTHVLLYCLAAESPLPTPLPPRP